jgi:hypothetical protein
MSDEMSRRVNSVEEVRKTHEVLENLRRSYQISILLKGSKIQGVKV